MEIFFKDSFLLKIYPTGMINHYIKRKICHFTLEAFSFKN